MKVFKKRNQAVALCNCANQFPFLNMMVKAVPGGWIITKATGLNASTNIQGKA
jgi:hypothetical protein